MMNECTWIIHAVSNYCECDNCKDVDAAEYDDVVFHTHGVAEFNNGLELELNMSLNPIIAAQIINYIAYSIKKEKVVVKDGLIDNSLFEYPVMFKKISPSVDGDFKEIMRIVLCDPQRNFPTDDNCEAAYRHQLSNYRRY